MLSSQQAEGIHKSIKNIEFKGGALKCPAFFINLLDIKAFRQISYFT